MVDVTLFKVNLEGSQFTANAPFSGSGGESRSGEKLSKMLPGTSSSAASSSSGESKTRQDDASNAAMVIAPILGLVALVGVYLASRKLRRKTAGEQHELDEFEGDAVEYEIES